MIRRSDKLTSEQPHGSRVAIAPAPILLIGEAPVTQIDRRPGRAKIRESWLILGHALTLNTK